MARYLGFGSTAASEPEGIKGKAFPCGRANVSADPFSGDTPQRPFRVRVRMGFP